MKQKVLKLQSVLFVSLFIIGWMAGSINGTTSRAALPNNEISPLHILGPVIECD